MREEKRRASASRRNNARQTEKVIAKEDRTVPIQFQGYSGSAISFLMVMLSICIELDSVRQPLEHLEKGTNGLATKTRLHPIPPQRGYTPRSGFLLPHVVRSGNTQVFHLSFHRLLARLQNRVTKVLFRHAI